jgi:hypothetical protein
MVAKKESEDDAMGLFVGIDHRVHGVLGGGEREAMKINSGMLSFQSVSFVISAFFDSLRSLLRSCLRQSISKAPPFRLWLNFLVGCGFVFEEAFLAE